MFLFQSGRVETKPRQAPHWQRVLRGMSTPWTSTMHWAAVKPPLNLLTCATWTISAPHSALVWLNDKSRVLTADAIGVDFAAEHQTTTGSRNFTKVPFQSSYWPSTQYLKTMWLVLRLLSFNRALKNKYCITLPHWSFSSEVLNTCKSAGLI